MPPPPDRHALSAACVLADALSDPHAFGPHPPPDPRRTDPQNLAGGAVGIALLHIERAHSGHGSTQTAHQWLRFAVSTPINAGATADLFYGAPAIGFVLARAASSTTYRTALTALDDKIARLTHARLTAATARVDRGDPLTMREFDLVHGLTGLGAHHLHRRPTHRLTHDILTYLVRITDHPPGQTTTPDRPAWWLADGLNGQPSPDQFPNGHANLGMAHGISGTLALLSHAVLRGITVPGIHEAIGRICAWLDQWRQPTPNGGAWWPGYLTIDNLRTTTVEPTQRPRPSWCYGISGTARAQQLAGLALADPTRQHDAENAMLSALRTADHRALEPEVGLCHGIAGMLHSAWRMANDAPTPHLADELPNLAAQLLAHLPDPATNAELMDGAAGAALALHTLGTGTAPASGWDAFLLLA